MKKSTTVFGSKAERKAFNAIDAYGAKYWPARAVSVSHRSTKLEFKLAMCSRSGLPLYVISFDEIQSLPGEDSLEL